MMNGEVGLQSTVISTSGTPQGMSHPLVAVLYYTTLDNHSANTELFKLAQVGTTLCVYFFEVDISMLL